MANNIGGTSVNIVTEQDLLNHPSITNIEKAGASQPGKFSFKLLDTSTVKLTLEKLNTRKASGYDAITPRILKHASGGIATYIPNKNL